MKFISPKYLFAFAFVLILIGTDDLPHSAPHRYLAPNLPFAFALVILKITNSEILLFHFALISVSMVGISAALGSRTLGIPKFDTNMPFLSGKDYLSREDVHWQFGTKKAMTATDVTGFYACFSALKSGNVLHISGPFPDYIAQ